MDCTRCGSPVAPGTNFCTVCGAAVPRPNSLWHGLSAASLVMGLLSVAYPVAFIVMAIATDFNFYFDYSYRCAPAFVAAQRNIWSLLLAMGVAMAVLAIVFAARAKKRLRQEERGGANAGLILGVVGLVIWPALIALFVYAAMAVTLTALSACATAG